MYIYAFDVAYEMTRQPVRELLGQPVAQFVVDASKRSPRQLFFYRPQMVRLPPLERIGPHGPVRVERVIKLLPVGAISISVRVPFEVEQVEDLVCYHDLQFSNGSLNEEVRRLAEEVRSELASHYIRPVRQLAEEEAYTVFCIESPLMTEEGTAVGAEAWWRANRRAVASLLTQEPDVDHLSKQEADESTGRFLSYYEHDLVVVDWDAALIIDERQNFDETLYVMELANLQLAELEAYDRILDDCAGAGVSRLERAADARAGGDVCASCGKSASTWRGSAMSCPTSPSSSGTGTWRAFTRTSRRGSTWATGTGPLIRSCRRWTIYTNCSITIRPIAGC